MVAGRSFLKLVSSEETNSFFDPEKAYDGGGYSQPHSVWKGAFDGKPLEVEVFDTSCGGFGHRWTMCVSFMGKSCRSELDEVDHRDPLDRWTCSCRLPERLDAFVLDATGYPFNPGEDGDAALRTPGFGIQEEQDGGRD